MTDDVVIGIDLGTTNSCVAVEIDGVVKIIHNENGENTTPSVVAFTNEERIVGSHAREKAFIDPKNVVYDSKRMIGRWFNDPDLQENIKRWPFVVFNDNDNPKIRVNKGLVKEHTPEAISAMVLEKMKKIAENYLSHPVKDAVITVPAHFSQQQKQATIDAGKIAGLNVQSIIIEPTAAAIAYGMQNPNKTEQNILIYDLGGGTFDVSILKVKDNDFDVLATGGNPNLGGQDFNNNLFDYCIERFSQKHGQIVQNVDKAHRRLKERCEAIKKSLSTTQSVEVTIEEFVNSMDFQMTITRDVFEVVNKKLFDSTIDVVEDTLNESELNADQIDEVILIGGSTRIPKIQQLLKDFFEGKTLTKKINPDEAVAYGAAVYGARSIQRSKKPESLVQLHDVLPISVGVKDFTGKMIKIFPRNTKYPAQYKQTWKTVKDNQTCVTVEIFEGERLLTEDNDRIGEFSLNKLPKREAGVVCVETIFTINKNGVLEAMATETSQDKWKHIKISQNIGRMSPEEVQRIAAEAEKYREEDEKKAQLLAAKAKLENLCMNMHTRATRRDCVLDPDSIELIVYRCTTTLDDLDKHMLTEKNAIITRTKMLEHEFRIMKIL